MLQSFKRNDRHASGANRKTLTKLTEYNKAIECAGMKCSKHMHKQAKSKRNKIKNVPFQEANKRLKP